MRLSFYSIRLRELTFEFHCFFEISSEDKPINCVDLMTTVLHHGIDAQVAVFLQPFIDEIKRKRVSFSGNEKTTRQGGLSKVH